MSEITQRLILNTNTVTPILKRMEAQGIITRRRSEKDERKVVVTLTTFALSVGLTFLIQWLVFIPAFRLQSEKFFDLTGSVTYISVISIAALLSTGLDARSILLWALVVIWAVRLGTFLFRRIHKAGKDDRFDEIKPSFIRYLNVWTIQGLWVAFTMAAALIAITTTNHKSLDIFAIIAFWYGLLGFRSRLQLTLKKAASMQTRKTRANLLKRVYGLAPATQITSVKLFSGSV